MSNVKIAVIMFGITAMVMFTKIGLDVIMEILKIFQKFQINQYFGHIKNARRTTRA